jgi:DNA polymerase III delta subunit
MEILKDSDFKKELKIGLKKGYLFFGEEDYLKSFAVRSAEEAVCPDPTFSLFNVMKPDALDLTPAKLVDALMPMPMMADRKLVVLSGLNFTTMRPNELDEFCEALSALEEYDYNTVIVNVTSDCLDTGYLPKSPSSALKKLAEHLVPVQFDRCTPSRLNAWVQKHFSHNGVTASPEFCAKMIDYCGRGMFQLANEINKLSCYQRYHGRDTVSEAELRLVCTPVTEYDAFAFANAVMEGKQEAALAILADYKFRRIEPVFILGEVVRIFCDMETIRAMEADGCSFGEIAAHFKQHFKYHEYKVSLYQKCLRQIPEKRLRRAIQSCVEADFAMKNSWSSSNYTALERLICSI